jgi:hypothetical protein
MQCNFVCMYVSKGSMYINTILSPGFIRSVYQSPYAYATKSPNYFDANSTLNMKLSHVAEVALISGVNASVGQDTLVAQGLLKLGQHVGANGYPEPNTCTIKEARVRREWYVQRKDLSGHVRWSYRRKYKFHVETVTNKARFKVNFVTSRKAELYRCSQMSGKQACKNSFCHCSWSEKSIR